MNFIGKDSNGHPAVVSVANTYGRDKWRTLVTTLYDNYRTLIPACKEKEVFQHVKTAFPQLGITKLNPVKNEKKFAKEFLQYEKLSVANNYKWGVLYLKEGQTEDQTYANSTKFLE